jgi:hypothetical protein
MIQVESPLATHSSENLEPFLESPCELASSPGPAVRPCSRSFSATFLSCGASSQGARSAVGEMSRVLRLALRAAAAGFVYGNELETENSS